MSEVNLKTVNGTKVVRNISMWFIVVIILLTFFSKTINNFLLPEVSSIEPSAGYLSYTIEAKGKVRISNTEKVFSRGQCKVLDVKVEEGAEISKGDLLATFDIEDVSIYYKKMELAILKMKNALENYKLNYIETNISTYERDVAKATNNLEVQKERYETAKSLYDNGAKSNKDYEEAKRSYKNATDDLDDKISEVESQKKKVERQRGIYNNTIQEKNLEIELEEMELKKIKNDFPTSGQIISNYNGIIKSISIEKGKEISNNQVMFEIITDESQFLVEWTLDERKAKLVNKGDNVGITISSGGEESYREEIVTKTFNGKSNLYDFITYIEKDKQQITDGMEAQILITKRGMPYERVIPKECINEILGRKSIYVIKERKGILGDEFYVESVVVEVEEEDDFNAAIIAGIPQEEYPDIVLNSTKPLTDGIAVKLR